VPMNTALQMDEKVLKTIVDKFSSE